MRNKLLVFAMAGFAVGALVFGLSTAPFFTRGEAREALVIQSMASQSNYILPLRNGFEIPSKPPMFHWLATLSSSVFPNSVEWSYRLPSAIVGGLGVAALFWFALLHTNLTVAMLAALIVLSSFEWMRSASNVRVDMTFCYFMTASVLLLYRLIMVKEKRYWRFVVLTALAVTAATLAKGPAALVLPFAIVGALALFRALRDRRFAALSLGSLLECFAIAFVLSASWYLAAYLIGGDAFFYRQILAENVARLTGDDSVNVGHYKPIYFVAIYFFTVALPWSFFLPLVVFWLKDHWRELPRREDVLLCLLWIMAFVVAVTFSASKRAVYFLPIVPPLAYLIALSLGDREWIAARALPKTRKALVYLFLVASGAFFCVATALLVLHFWSYDSIVWLSEVFTSKHPEKIAHILDAIRNSFFAVLLLGFASIVGWIVARSIPKSRFRLIGFLISAVSLSIGTYVPRVLWPVLEREVAAKEFAQQVNQKIAADAVVYQFKHNFYQAAYYLERDIKRLKEGSPELSEGSGYLLVRGSDLMQVRMQLPESREIFTSASLVANGRDTIHVFTLGEEGRDVVSEELLESEPDPAIPSERSVDESSSNEEPTAEHAAMEADEQTTDHPLGQSPEVLSVEQLPTVDPDKAQQELESNDSQQPQPIEDEPHILTEPNQSFEQ